MEKGYAYIGKGGFLLISHSVNTARENAANGKYESVRCLYSKGRPQVMENDKRVSLVIDTRGERPEEKNSRAIPKQLKELVERLK